MSIRACVFRGCEVDGVVQRTRNVYCEKHYRFYQMRQDAKHRGKAVPSITELDAMVQAVMVDGVMACSHCRKPMGWRIGIVGRRSVATIQHDDSGAMRLLCGSCNFTHAWLGDIFYDIPPGHQRCWACRTVKACADFWRSKHTKSGHASICRVCRYAKFRAWLTGTPSGRASYAKQLVKDRARHKTASRGEAFRGGEAAAFEREQMAATRRATRWVK